MEQRFAGRLFSVEQWERAVADPQRLNRITETAYPKAMFVLMPLFALLTHVAWRRRVPRYPAHLYLALHLHAAMFGILALIKLAAMVVTSDTGGDLVGLAGRIYLLGYLLVTLRRVFDDSWVKTVAKAAVVGAVYSVCLFAVSVGMLAYALATI